jgi:flagellar assembly factor FliW
MDDPDLALPLTRPWRFFPRYEVELSDSEAERIGVREPAEADVFVTIRAAEEASDFSANLRAPRSRATRCASA